MKRGETVGFVLQKVTLSGGGIKRGSRETDVKANPGQAHQLSVGTFLKWIALGSQFTMVCHIGSFIPRALCWTRSHRW